MKIHATSVIKDETIKIYYFALLFQLLNISVILKLYDYFFLMKSLKTSQFYREHLRKHAWKHVWELFLFRKQSVQ